MRKTLILSVVFIFIVSLAFSQTKLGKHKIELEDPIGDVRDDEGKPGKDVTKVSIISDGENLHIMAELKEDVSYYLNDQMAGPVVEFHFNSDNNERTGGIPFWGKNRKGFEYQVDLIACIQYKNGGLACVGSAGSDIEGFISSYKLSQYEQDKKMPKAINSILESTQKEITGKQIEITIPYSEVGFKSGGRARIAIRESDSSFDDASYFPLVFFIIK